MVVAHDGEPWLPRTLEALSRQTRRPDVVVAVDTGSTDASGELLRTALGAGQVLQAPRDTGFGAAVRQGLAHAATLVPAGAPDEPPGPEAGAAPSWLWVLHDDSAPQPRALELLLDAASSSSSVGVAGPKLVSWDDADLLLEAGLTVSRAGRRSAFVDGPERDQGQHDHRSDVLAVPSAGLLVRRDVWDELGGFDPALRLLRDDVDLCWRAHLAGHRVILAPRAVVADAQASTRGLRRVDAVPTAVRRVDRQHGQHVALARCGWAVLPFLLVWLVVVGAARALALLAAKSPGRAWDEVRALAVTLLLPWRWLASRWRSRGRRRVRGSSLSSLMTPRFAAVRHATDVLGGWAARDGDDVVDLAAVPTETGPVAEEAEPAVLAPTHWWRRVATHPLTSVCLLLVAMTLVEWRRLLGTLFAGGGTASTELRPATAAAPELWHSAVDAVRGAGLGTQQAASPAALLHAGGVWLVSLVAGDAAPAVSVVVLLLAAPLLAGLTAYLGAGLCTRSRWSRAWAALVWGTAPVLTSALAQGRVGPVAAAVLLPVVAALTARALMRRASGVVTATFAAALGIAVLGALVPVLGAVGVLVGLVGTLLCRGGARLRALAIAVLPVALQGPWLREVALHPRLQLAGPGAVADAVPPVAVPGGLQLPGAWLRVVQLPHASPHWALAVWAAPLVLLAGIALLRGGARGRAATALGWLAVLGLALAVVAPDVVLSRSGAATLTAWAGTGALVGLLALVAAPVVAADGLQTRLARYGFGWRQVLLGPAVLLAVLSPLAAAAGAAWQGVSPPLRHTAAAGVPAVAADAAAGPAAARTLVLESARGRLTYRLDGGEPGEVVRDLPRTATDPASRPAAAAVGATVATLVTPGTPPAAAAAVSALHRLAVAFVLVREPVPPALGERLDATAGLARIGRSADGQLWRVGAGGLDQAARVRVESPQGRLLAVVPVTGPHASVDTTLAADTPAGVLVLAEPVSPLRHAELDGRPLATAVLGGPDSWRQAYTLPAGGGHLVVQATDASARTWRWAQLGLLALVVLLALPVRRPSGELR